LKVMVVSRINDCVCVCEVGFLDLNMLYTLLLSYSRYAKAVLYVYGCSDASLKLCNSVNQLNNRTMTQ